MKCRIPDPTRVELELNKIVGEIKAKGKVRTGGRVEVGILAIFVILDVLLLLFNVL